MLVSYKLQFTQRAGPPSLCRAKYFLMRGSILCVYIHLSFAFSVLQKFDGIAAEYLFPIFIKVFSVAFPI